jgi:hypothetical protein
LTVGRVQLTRSDDPLWEMIDRVAARACRCECGAKDARIAELEAEVARLRGALQNIRMNFEHDPSISYFKRSVCLAVIDAAMERKS